MTPRTAKLATLLVSIAISVGMGIFAYRYLRRGDSSAPQVAYQGAANHYAVSMYNTRGQLVSEKTGALKLALDPFTIYRNYPNQTTESYSIDERGFRVGFREAGPTDLAMLLGGSAAFGQGLSDDLDTFSSLISRASKKYDVINCGVIGFASGQELSLMVHYLDHHRPSLYIVFDGWNDIFASFDDVQSWPKRGGPLGFNRNFFMIEGRLAAHRREQLVAANEKAIRLPPIATALSEREYYNRIRDNYLSNLGKMHAFAASRGASFLVVFQPELGLKSSRSPEEEEILETWNRTRGYIDKDIPGRYRQLLDDAQEFCRSEQITFLDINRVPEFTDSTETLFFDAVHPNETGHRVIADAVGAVLLASF